MAFFFLLWEGTGRAAHWVDLGRVVVEIGKGVGKVDLICFSVG